jgi:hypothetical protein
MLISPTTTPNSKTMNSEEFFKRLQEGLAHLSIPVTRDNPSPEELQRTIFLFPPKVRPKEAKPPTAPQIDEKEGA